MIVRGIRNSFLVVFFLGAVSLWSDMLPFFSFSPYIGGDNQWCVRYELGLMRFAPLLWFQEISFLYSPTTEASVDIAVPVWYWTSSDVVLGDVTVDFRGVLAKDEMLSWRVMTLLGIRFPTGIPESAGKRRVNGVEVSYFPYTGGALGWRGGFVVSYLGLPVWFHGTAVYQSEYHPDETLLDFNASDDLLLFQGMGDFLLRFSWGKVLLSSGVVSWVSWGSYWGLGARFWQRSTFFILDWRAGYEVSYWPGEVYTGIFVQYNF